jgi:hypothetical protein
MSAEAVEFDALVRGALTESMTTGQRAVLDACVTTAMARRDQQRPRIWRRLTARTSLVVAALVLVILPSVFVVSAGVLMSESPLGLASATDFQREIDAAKAVTPIPTGSTWPAALQAQKGSSYSKGGAYQWVESTALCLWLGEWLRADRAAERGRGAAAAEVIFGYPTWRSYTGQFATQSYRDVIDRAIDAVRRADRGPVSSYVALNCAAQP